MLASKLWWRPTRAPRPPPGDDAAASADVEVADDEAGTDTMAEVGDGTAGATEDDAASTAQAAASGDDAAGADTMAEADDGSAPRRSYGGGRRRQCARRR